jgi:hypothetical protein
MIVEKGVVLLKRWPGSRSMRAVVEKLRAAMGRLGIAEVLRLRAISAMSSDKPVRRFAQDDDSLGELTG